MSTPREIIARIACECAHEDWTDAEQASWWTSAAARIEGELTSASYHILSDADLAARDDAALERAAMIAHERAEGRERLFSENGASISASKDVEAEEISAAIRSLKGGKP